MKKFTKTILRGVSQVMLQNNAITGLIFLVGISYNSWLAFLGAVFGNIISTVTAYLFRYNNEDIENGLYGFNGTLVGIAVFFYFGLSFYSILFIIIGSFISSVVMNIMKKKMIAFTAPFVISTWLVIIFVKLFNIIPIINHSVQQTDFLNIFQGIITGFGQVMFQASIITGIILFIGILINSRISALFAVYGVLLSILISLFLSLSVGMISLGIFSYNAILVSIALGDKTKKMLLFVSIAIMLSVIFTYLFGKFGIIALTAPFVISTWIVLFIKNKNLF